MSKQYNLSTTEDNGQSVTTSQTVTEHPEEILRLMKLAGLENAQVVAEDGEWANTPDGSAGPNDKLDLDDYSKKSPESIAKQKKTIQPTLGDNPLEYSLDENEIQEALSNDFDEMEEGWTTDKVKQIGGALGKGSWKGLKKLSRLGSKNVSSKFDGKGHVSTTTRYNEDEEEKLDEIIPLVPAAIKAVGKGIKRVSKSDQVKTILKPEKVKLAKGGGLKQGSKAGRATAVTMPEGDKAVEGTTVSASRKSPTIIKPVSPADKAKADATNYASDEKLIKKAVNRKRNYNDDGIAPPSGHHNNTSNRWAESTEEVTEAQSPAQKAAFAKMLAAKNGKKDETKETKETTVEENLKEAEKQIKALKEDCSCGHGSSCDCGSDCGCGCNAVSENSYNENDMEDTKKIWAGGVHVNGSQETEEIEAIIRRYWDELPDQLRLDLDMHFDSLKGEFDESQEVEQSQERISKLINY